MAKALFQIRRDLRSKSKRNARTLIGSGGGVEIKKTFLDNWKNFKGTAYQIRYFYWINVNFIQCDDGILLWL